MRNLSTLIVGLLIIAVLLLYMITFQVDFNRAVVVTTFGKATDVYAGAEGAGGAVGNLHFKWIWPIQKVYSYDARVQTLETRLEQMQTADKQTVIPALFVTWQITDAMAFHTALRSEDEARKQLQARLRDAKTQLSEYTFDELTAADPAKLKLDEAERDIRQSLQTALDEAGYGLTVKTVGIKRLVLPDEVTQKVFDRMRATRERLAQKARSEGIAAATKIRSQANSARDRILSFADERASQIRAEGLAAVADIVAVFKEDEQFAIFQRKIDAMKQALNRRTTIFADPSMIPFDEFRNEANGGTP